MECLAKIEHWSRVFGLPIHTEDNLPSEDRLKLSVDLITEEVLELVEAVDNKDLIEIPDALGDILWVTVRAFMEMGYDVEKVIDEIYKSNMSKICPDEKSAQETVKAYKELGFDTYYEEVSDGFIVKDSKTHKVKKYFGWKEPDFTDYQKFRIFNDKS